MKSVYYLVCFLLGAWVGIFLTCLVVASSVKKKLGLYQHQIGKLACFILTEVPGEPSQPEGAVDTAIRIIREHLRLKGEAEASGVLERVYCKNRQD